MRITTNLVKIGVSAVTLSLALSVSAQQAKSAPISTAEFAQSIDTSIVVKPVLISQWFPWRIGRNNSRSGDRLCIQAGGNGKFLRSRPINGGFGCDFTKECFKIDYWGRR